MPRFDIYQGKTYLGNVPAADAEAAVAYVEADEDFMSFIDALHLDGNPPITATEAEGWVPDHQTHQLRGD